jgi:hypothetical protein
VNKKQVLDKLAVEIGWKSWHQMILYFNKNDMWFPPIEVKRAVEIALEGKKCKMKKSTGAINAR